MQRRVGRWAAVTLATTFLCFVAAGCGGDDDEGDAGGAATTEASGAPEGMMETLGDGEGQVNLIAWAGYVEDGSTDPKVDWVSDFEADTGCKVNTKVGNTSDEMVTLMRTGQYDGVSASGDATLRLIAAGDVAPVNTDLIPNYADVFDGLKDQAHNSVDGQMYGVPHGRGANLLMWRTDKVTPAPDSWSVVWDENSPYKGKVTAYDSPIYIADAALYLKATQPDLEIDNVYELDDTQFQAAVDLLKKQRTNIGEYWSDYTKAQAAFAAGNTRPRHDVASDREPARRGQGARRDDAAEGGLDRLVGHLDDLLQGRAPELHVHVDGPHHLPAGECRGRRVVRGGAVQLEVVCADGGQEPLHDLPRGRRGLLLQGRVLDDAGEGLRRRPGRGVQGLLGMGPGLDGDQGVARPLGERASLPGRRPGAAPFSFLAPLVGAGSRRAEPGSAVASGLSRHAALRVCASALSPPAAHRERPARNARS